MMRIYVAGPYSKGDVENNVKIAIMYTSMLMNLGYAPFCPHLYHYVDALESKSYDQLMSIDLEFLNQCNVLMRIPGESPGADIEVKAALELGIPVLNSISEAIDFIENAKVFIGEL